MITKAFEIRDSMTFIPVIATKLDTTDYLVRRAGFITGTAPVMIVRLDNCISSFKSDEWSGFGRTMPVAHRYIQDNFDSLENGAVVDVQFILEETKEPKRSERHG